MPDLPTAKPKSTSTPWQDPSLDSERESDATLDRRTERDKKRAADARRLDAGG